MQGYFSPSAGTGVWDGQWHLVAGAFDQRGAWRFYVDGRQVGNGTAAPVNIQYSLPQRQFTIADFINSCPDAGNFVGDIDEVRVYRRALSPTEIARLAGAPVRTRRRSCLTAAAGGGRWWRHSGPTPSGAPSD